MKDFIQHNLNQTKETGEIRSTCSPTSLAVFFFPLLVLREVIMTSICHVLSSLTGFTDTCGRDMINVIHTSCVQMWFLC